MAEPFKNFVDASAVATLGDAIAAGTPSFPAEAFVAEASVGLDALELKPRVRHVAAALRRHLPAAWPEALQALLRALPQPLPDASAVSQGFVWWPVLQVVEDYGLDHPELSVAALGEMTRRFSAEFAIRPYLVAHPEPTWRALQAWVDDPDVHVRRLVSEGTRPRLPWGLRLRDAVADPSRGLALVEQLRDDPEAYVRRSVANHLNDVAKDHPERVVALAERWMQGAPEPRRELVRHALRTLTKRGHAGALAVLGFGEVALAVAGPHLDRDTVDFGGAVQVTVTMRSTGSEPQALMVDWVVHYLRANGSLSPKVFRGPRKTLAPGEAWTARRTVALRPVTTRRHYPGVHEVEVQINGVGRGKASFELVGGDAG